VGRVVSLEELAAAAERLRQAGRALVFTNGVFDLLHAGHVYSLQAARALGDALAVGVNSDRAAQALKGPGRPIIPQEDRAALLAALAAVDYVVIVDSLDMVPVLARVRPAVYAKGGDWTAETLPEAPVVQAYGGSIRLIPRLPGRSTTEILERVRRMVCAEHPHP